MAGGSRITDGGGRCSGGAGGRRAGGGGVLEEARGQGGCYYLEDWSMGEASGGEGRRGGTDPPSLPPTPSIISDQISKQKVLGAVTSKR